MKLNNTVQRILLFLISIPLLYLFIFHINFYHHILLTIMILIFTAGASLELARLFKNSGIKISQLVYMCIGTITPLLFFISRILVVKRESSSFILLGVAAIIVIFLTPFAFTRKAKFQEVLPRVAAYSFALLYPGILSGFIILIVLLHQGTVAITTFVILVIANDSLAWLIGITLGKRRAIIDASPNKSIAGFVGGLIGSCLAISLIWLLFPDLRDVNFFILLLFALLVGVSTIIGDLFESALKRSARTKDSGNIIPGRGGILDSFDSYLFAAPVFFVLTYLFKIFE